MDWSHLKANPRPKDGRDILLGGAAAPVPIPPALHVDLSWLKRNFQGKTYFCGEHAGTHLKAILDYGASTYNGADTRKTPRYGAIKLKDPKSPVCDGFAIDAGTDMRSIFKWLQKVGAADFEPLENDVTLPHATYCDPNVVTPAMDANAATSLISNYGFGNTDFNSLCQYIYQSKAVLLLIKCDDGFFGTSIPTFTTQKYGHFVVAYDYDLNGIYVIDSADPVDAFALKYISKQYITPKFIIESGTALDTPYVKPPVVVPAAPVLPPNPTIPQEQNWLTALLQWLNNLSSLIGSTKGRGFQSETMDTTTYPWWVSSTGQGVAQRIISLVALVIPVFSYFGVNIAPSSVEVFVNAAFIVGFGVWQLWAWARANFFKQNNLGKYARQ